MPPALPLQVEDPALVARRVMFAYEQCLLCLGELVFSSSWQIFVPRISHLTLIDRCRYNTPSDVVLKIFLLTFTPYIREVIAVPLEESSFPRCPYSQAYPPLAETAIPFEPE
jgi:hypothetical protein